MKHKFHLNRKCSTRKTRFETEEQAYKFLEDKGLVMRVYYCQTCHGYHITSQKNIKLLEREVKLKSEFIKFIQ
jgi:hypothetical protein